MHIKLSDFVPSGHTVEIGGVTYGVPVAAAEVMLEFIALESRVFTAPNELQAALGRAEEEGWANDEPRVMETIRESATRIETVGGRIKELAVGLLREANPDVPDGLKVSVPGAFTIIRLALGQDEEVSAQQMAAEALSLDKEVSEGDADPPTPKQRGGTGTMTAPRSRTATRSRKRSSS